MGENIRAPCAWVGRPGNSQQAKLLTLRHTEREKFFPLSHFLPAHWSEESEALPGPGCAITGKSPDFSVSPENWDKDTTYLTYTLTPTPAFSRLQEPRNREGRQNLKSQIRPDYFFSLCKMRTIVLSDTSEFGRGPNELTFALKSTRHTVSAICLLLFLLAS